MTMLCGTDLNSMRVAQVMLWMEVLRGRRQYTTLAGVFRDAVRQGMLDGGSDLNEMCHGLFFLQSFPNPMWALWGVRVPRLNSSRQLAPVYHCAFHHWNCEYRQELDYGQSSFPKLIHIVIAFLGNFHDCEGTGWPMSVASTRMSSSGCCFRWGVAFGGRG